MPSLSYNIADYPVDVHGSHRQGWRVTLIVDPTFFSHLFVILIPRSFTTILKSRYNSNETCFCHVPHNIEDENDYSFLRLVIVLFSSSSFILFYLKLWNVQSHKSVESNHFSLYFLCNGYILEKFIVLKCDLSRKWKKKRDLSYKDRIRQSMIKNQELARTVYAMKPSK